jgi:biopolymer transport protein ExbB
MNLLTILLQVTTDTVNNTPTTVIMDQNYFNLFLKGGWILVPLVFLFILSIYIFIERQVSINMLGKNEPEKYARINELVSEGKIERAINSCNEKPSSYTKVLAAGLEASQGEDIEIQDAMQCEVRQQISILEKGMNYLGLTAAIAPMFGFLGTIFGVIKIFYNISITNDLNIANISDGLYQKMICSCAGLFVGILAYTGFYILNSRIDKIITRIDKYTNDLLKEIRVSKREKKA